MRYKACVVLENEYLGENEGRLWIRSKELAEEAKPGQFVMLSLKDDEVFLPRAISINRVVDDKIAFAYQVVGKGTKLFRNLNVGNAISYLGPLGRGFDLSPTKEKILLIGGGIGRAPIEWLSQTLLEQDNEVTLVFGGKNKESLGGLIDLSCFDKCTWRLVTDDGSLGIKGLVTDVLDDFSSFDKIYACGPTPMMIAIKQLAEKYNKTLQLSLEGKMACGMGVCLGCTCNTKNEIAYPKVCKDGPVFWKEEVELVW